jgi:hypothetical protein
MVARETSVEVKRSDLPAGTDFDEFRDHVEEAAAFDPDIIADSWVEETADGFVLTVLAEATAEEVLIACIQTYGPA